MRYFLPLLFLALPASAADVTITLNDQEQQALVQLLDTANKAGGLQNAETVVYFVKKIQAAQAPKEPPKEPPKTKE